ncbi:MAG: pilus assembly protein [Actinobacteria bacterium]|nr:pilus assembly protein [Actinomycetota bacterium]
MTLPRLDRDERGTAALEFSLVSLLVFLLLFGIIDFGLAMNAQLVLVSAAREGARRAAVDGGASQQAYGRIHDYLSLGPIDPDRAAVTITPREAGYGGSIRVEIAYRYRLLTPLVRSAVGEGINLHAVAYSRSEKLR